MANVNWGGVISIAVVFGGLSLWAWLSLRRDAKREERRRRADPAALAVARRRHPSSRMDRHGKSLSRRERCEWERITGALPDLAELENKS